MYCEKRCTNKFEMDYQLLLDRISWVDWWTPRQNIR